MILHRRTFGEVQKSLNSKKKNSKTRTLQEPTVPVTMPSSHAQIRTDRGTSPAVYPMPLTFAMVSPHSRYGYRESHQTIHARHSRDDKAFGYLQRVTVTSTVDAAHVGNFITWTVKKNGKTKNCAACVMMWGGVRCVVACGWVMTDFGQTDFGQQWAVRLWQDRLWPELVF